MTLPSFTIKNIGQKDFFVIVPREGIEIQILTTLFWNYNRDTFIVPFVYQGTCYFYITTPNVDVEYRRKRNRKKKNERIEFGITE